MRKFVVAIVLAIACLAVDAAPYCCYFNNDENKVTIVFTDNDASGEYIVSGVTLFPVEVKKGTKPIRLTLMSLMAWQR